MRKYLGLALLVVASFGCSEKKKPDAVQSALVGEAVGKAKKRLGPLTKSDKESLRDCGKGAWVYGVASVIKLDSACNNRAFAQIALSSKYSSLEDAIILGGTLWVLVDSKSGRPKVLRFTDILNNRDEIDEAPEIALDAEDGSWEFVSSDGFAYDAGKLWVNGRTKNLDASVASVAIDASGVIDLDTAHHALRRGMFRSGGRRWRRLGNNSVMPVDEDFAAGYQKIMGLRGTKILDGHGSESVLVLSVRHKDSGKPQFLVINGTTMDTERAVDLPFEVDTIVVAHGYIWGLSIEEHKLIRAPVGGGNVETVMTVAKPEDQFQGLLSADSASVWLTYKAETWDSGTIRFDPNGQATGFVGHLRIDDRFFEVDPE